MRVDTTTNSSAWLLTVVRQGRRVNSRVLARPVQFQLVTCLCVAS